MPVDLTYNIPEEQLSGTIDATVIDVHAGSGGRAGSTTKGVVNWYLQNNPFATGVHRGPHGFGPLPLGRYTMLQHEVHPHWVWLVPLAGSDMLGRSGFAIHPRGPIGSHGCIVPDNAQDVIRILHAIAHRKADGGPDPILEVIAVGSDLDRKLTTA